MRSTWKPNAGDRAWALAEHELAESDTGWATDEFVTYWIERGEAKADWSRAWRNRVTALVEHGRLVSGGAQNEVVVENGLRIPRHG